ncbi:MAG: SagB/ThcOx family dehydrogenase [Thermodesulfobacteriota bacterium]
MEKSSKGVIRYHESTKHRPDRYADSPGFLDWANQPDPFRTFKGSEAIKLPFIKKDPPGDFDSLFKGREGPAKPFNLESTAAFLELSLSLSAWKSYEGASWSLRINPSSGNLHPEECYLILPPLKEGQVKGGLFHYNSYHHHLERRAEFDEDFWAGISENFRTKGFLAALTSIFWREAWKYGERAFRYSNLDLGHAAGAMSLSAGLLGWKLTSLSALSDDDIETLLGFDGTEWIEDERDHPGPLYLVHAATEEPASRGLPPHLIDSFRQLKFTGKPERLSAGHRGWPLIKEVSLLTRRPAAGDASPPASPPATPPDSPPDSNDAGFMIKNPPGVSGAEIIRRRRSGQAYDSSTPMAREDLFAILALTLPRRGYGPFSIFPAEARVHLALFVHRVRGLKSGLYILVRNKNDVDDLREKLSGEFLWEEAGGKVLPLYLLKEGFFTDEARFICCNQDIAGDGAFSVAMLARFCDAIEKAPWMYRDLHWEAGVTGQVLYLGAEARGFRGTGIGCFYDDLFHEFIGLAGISFQSLYHFTVGSPLEDRRVSTLPAYHHLKGMNQGL